MVFNLALNHYNVFIFLPLYVYSLVPDGEFFHHFRNEHIVFVYEMIVYGRPLMRKDVTIFIVFSNHILSVREITVPLPWIWASFTRVGSIVLVS